MMIMTDFPLEIKLLIISYVDDGKSLFRIESVCIKYYFESTRECQLQCVWGLSELNHRFEQKSFNFGMLDKRDKYLLHRSLAIKQLIIQKEKYEQEIKQIILKVSTYENCNPECEIDDEDSINTVFPFVVETEFGSGIQCNCPHFINVLVLKDQIGERLSIVNCFHHSTYYYKHESWGGPRFEIII